MSDERLTFPEAVSFCAANDEFVRNFDRLRGTSLSTFGRRAPIEAMIDEATGKERSDLFKFVKFVWEHVWLTMPFHVEEP